MVMEPFAVGLDVGSVAVKAVALDAHGDLVAKEVRRVEGHPMTAVREALFALLANSARDTVRLGVTGGGRSLLAHVQEAAAENDLVSTALAVARLYPWARGVIEVGGHRSSWLRLSADGSLESFALNDQCAAGSGAFLEQQAGRLKMDIEEFARLASTARRGASIAGRCSVFAKSDMIHLQQRGTPPAEIAYGLCVALARNFQATMLKGTGLALPAILCGGGALNDGLFRAFREVFAAAADQLVRCDQALYLAAFGAGLQAMSRGQLVDLGELLAHGHLLPPAKLPASAMARLEAPRSETVPEPVLAASGSVRAYLGVDVGSVSTDFALVSPSGEVLDGIYLPTRGDPVAVVEEGLSILRSRAGTRLTVLGVGTTGSGRHLAGRLLGADVVKNEITCQLLGARHACPDVDTILEIGGQDSKFVSVRDGRIADFVMNKICAAGTGSFLEEQAEALGIAIKGEFASLALAAPLPADLGAQCTVFMDTAVVGSRQQGARVADICAGLAYSVARNYMEKVVAGRPVGRNVVFQGGVASNAAVVAAFERILGRSVTVHPHNRISGAVGAALAAQREMNGRPSAFRGLDAASAVSASTFECTVCSNLCQVSRIRVGTEESFFGDVCERYTSREARAAVSTLPDLFGEREEMVESYAGGEARVGTVGIPRATLMYEVFPFWATFFRRLGFRVVMSAPTTMATLEEGVKRLAAETCLPVKLAYGHVSQLLSSRVDFVFLPSVLDLPDGESARTYMCPYVENIGFMVSTFARDRMMVPAVSLASPQEAIVKELSAKLDYFDLPPDEVRDALSAAEAAMEEFRQKLLDRGREVLASDIGVGFVVVGKPYNRNDPFQNLNLARHLRRLGILPIPMDMVPQERVDLDAAGADVAWRYNRDALRTLVSISRDPRLFPVVVSNFGCGPDAFGLKLFERMAAQRPYLLLEFDEHRGEAGLVTRLEAFIDEVSHSAPAPATRRLKLSAVLRTPSRSLAAGRRFVIPNFSDHAAAYLGAMRFAGFDAEMLPPPDAETLLCGEEHSSGKECHAYIITVGDLVKHVRSRRIGNGDAFFFPGTTVPCLLHQWGRGMELALERMGPTDVQVLSPGTAGHKDLFGFDALVRLWRGLVAVDLMTRAGCQIRPYARDPASVDEVLADTLEQMPDAMARDELEDLLGQADKALQAIPKAAPFRRCIVGVAGDIYTRAHPFANHDLFHRLERAGLEVWPAPFLVDTVDFGLRKALVDGFYDGRYMESAGAAMLLLRTEMEKWRVRFHLGWRLERTSEPGYQDVLDMARPYLDGRTNEILVLNVAKMVDYARRGADGVINAISFHCMLGTISASLTERIRRDHDMVPISTFVFSGTSGEELDNRTEAFAHQVRSFAQKHRPA
jgi:predicted CoA-substrate-specific enzyme activase